MNGSRLGNFEHWLRGNDYYRSLYFARLFQWESAGRSHFFRNRHEPRMGNTFGDRLRERESDDGVVFAAHDQRR